ncbi:hypothetical protein Ssi02_73810 [Sinosporangium siamense]|uniref:Transposase IS701-like DDE domain-containing protein n=1 Tax=Sinosporangium siamense TaxID=1367973 RepID=A0A919RNQ5_9ACTN|nr:hypothetical protein Ssi02_73810 [Sinosporangium siamense]
MTKPKPCPPAAGPLEKYAARFDDLFSHLAQRRGFREYLTGLLAPRERNKTLTALAGAEPVAGAQHAAVQRLQFFLTESVWDPVRVNARRLELLADDPASAPHANGVLVVDDSGDRKDGTATAHVGHQWLGRYGKTDNGIVTVTTLWADERLYHPLHAVPYPRATSPQKERPGLPHQTPTGRGPGRAGGPGGGGLPRGGGRLRLRRPGRLAGLAAYRRGRLGGRRTAPVGHLGLRRPGAHPA